MTAEEFALLTNASPSEMHDLQQFRAELETWNARLNLVGPSALKAFWDRHVLDSAQLLHVEQSALRWLDVGAGAGFPGIVLAILLKRREGACVHLVESMAKRVRFLQEVATALGLPVQIHHGRAEVIPPPEGLQIVTARACAPLSRLFAYTQHFFRSGAEGLFLKGRDVQAELTEAGRSWNFDVRLTDSQSDPSGRLVRIRGLTPRGA